MGQTTEDEVELDPSSPANADEIVLATYNVETLFDTSKDPGTNDHEFLPHGWYNWTEEKLAQKLSNLSRVLRAINGGRGPDIVALNEVENRGIVQRLRDEYLQDLGYETLVHKDTVDYHGLDNAVLSRFPLAREPKLHAMHVSGTQPEKRPRGVLEVALDIHGIPLTLFVNHWPAGKDPRAQAQRRSVGARLRALIEERSRETPGAEVLVLGDFNASPGDEAFGSAGLQASADHESVRNNQGAVLYNTIAHHAKSVTGAPLESLAHLQDTLNKHGATLGTHHTRAYPYTGPDAEWNSFDQIFIAAGLLDQTGLAWVPGSTRVLREAFMVTEEGSPKAFYEPGVDPRKQVLDRLGFSDHLPVVTRLRRCSR